MFIAPLLRTAKNWKQPACPSVGEWMTKHATRLNNGILLSTEKKEAIKPWRDMEETERILLSEKSQPDQAVSCLIQRYSLLEKENYENNKMISGYQGWRKRENTGRAQTIFLGQ